MDIDGVVTVDLQTCTDIDVAQRGEWEVYPKPSVAILSIKRPYLINIEKIEYIEGDWNEDKTEYGIRIGYVSGKSKCFWGATARKVLEDLGYYFRLSESEREEVYKKFDDRIKAGPPAV